MSVDVWGHVSALAEHIESRFKDTGSEIVQTSDHYDWYNNLYQSLRYRRAHVEIVDKRSSHKTYILHCTIFPHFNDPSPIWGFDAVCGASKITGAFHDFSAAGDRNHSMMKWFANTADNYKWKKTRDLPDWAQAIFSPAMIAVGNINSEEEIQAICNLAKSSLDYYLDNVGITQESGSDFHMAQNRYCHYQKQNPRVIHSMVSMGVPEETIVRFVEEMLFPETV
jgi:hypothetical protein